MGKTRRSASAEEYELDGLVDLEGGKVKRAHVWSVVCLGQGTSSANRGPASLGFEGLPSQRDAADKSDRRKSPVIVSTCCTATPGSSEPVGLRRESDRLSIGRTSAASGADVADRLGGIARVVAYPVPVSSDDKLSHSRRGFNQETEFRSRSLSRSGARPLPPHVADTDQAIRPPRSPSNVPSPSFSPTTSSVLSTLSNVHIHTQPGQGIRFPYSTPLPTPQYTDQSAPIAYYFVKTGAQPSATMHPERRTTRAYWIPHLHLGVDD